MAKMSNREKNMVFFLLIVCVVVIGYKFLLEPQMLATVSNEATYEQLEEEKAIVDLVSNQNSEYSQNYAENLAALEELQEYIGPYLEDEELDDRMTDLLAAKGLEVTSLAIAQEASGYTTSGLESITTKSVSMVATGTISEILSFVEEFYDSTDCIVASMSIASVSDSITSEYTLTITVAVYMETPVVVVEEEVTEDTAE